MAYESPIQVMMTGLETQLEGEILTATRKVGVVVDKDELIRALKYDRDQYEKGYQDGYRVAMEYVNKQLDSLKEKYYENGRNG